jgi:hypothetical protein
MNEIRSLTLNKTAAALASHKVPTDEVLAKTPTALAASKSYTLPLVCKRTGITVGSLNLATVAGHMPVIGQWKESMVLHPLFSLEATPLLHFARNTWFRFCSFNVEENGDPAITDKQVETLRVTALALLYQLTEIRQDIPFLPPWKDVSAHWSSLVALSFWKTYLDSKRFRFPSLHISRMESEFDLKSFLNVCWDCKKSYETKVTEKIELERLKRAEEATIALRDELAGARPTSNRQLWRWFVANMPPRYKPDTEGWMATLFFAKGEEIRNFTIADVDLFEEIFLCECPTGSSISHAFSEILASKRKYLQDHFEAFEIMVPASITAAKEAGEIPVEEPQLKDFATRVQWLVARAKWKLAHTDLSSKMRAAVDKQAAISVKASHIPTLVIREGDAPDYEEPDESVQLDSMSEEDDETDGSEQ